MEYSNLDFSQRLEWLWNCATSVDCLLYYWFRVLLIILFIIVLLCLIFVKNPFIVRSDWHHFYADYQFSAQEFYQKVEEKLKEIKLPGVSYEKRYFLETHLLSARREYLALYRNEYAFFISGAHFGKGSYVSWWMTEEIESPLNKIPIVSKWFGKDRKKKTFYQLDTEAMYKAAVHDCVLEVLDDMTKFNVQRPLSDIERQYRDRPIA